MAAVAMLPSMLATWYLGNVRTACNLPEAMAYFQAMAADFKVQALPVNTLCIDGTSNFLATSHFLWSNEKLVLLVPLTLMCVLPGTLLNLALSIKTVNGNFLTAIVFTLVSAAPLCLLAVGADVIRFATLIQMTSLLALISIIRNGATPSILDKNNATPPISTILSIAAFELGSVLTLADGSPMLKFPFLPLVARIVEISTGQANFVVIQDY
jgi:hypothetical protein